jgi:AAA15 family ATPase/GTPase
MWVKTLQLYNVNGFESTSKIVFSKSINLLIGKNNSGKSTIIKSLYKLQNSASITNHNLRIGKKMGHIKIIFEDFDALYFIDKYDYKENLFEPMIKIDLFPNTAQIPLVYLTKTKENSKDIISSVIESAFVNPEEPYNFIYPYLSKRKVTSYDLNVNLKNTSIVEDSFHKIVSKVARIDSSGYPEHDIYVSLCKDLIGYGISTYSFDIGQKAGLIIDKQNKIPIDQMGEGTVNMLGLIVSLLESKNKLFLIEELENDIHPEALKKMLNLIIESSKKNQFIITTHSNIVAKYLGSIEGSKLFETKMELQNKLPLCTIREVENKPNEKRKVLENLGYELYDFDLWEGYLILEESSAESVIQYLIKWFVPESQNKLRTISAQGKDKVEAKLEDFGRLLTFLNSEPIYLNKTWVILDNNAENIIDTIKEKFIKWNKEQFKTFSKDDFEEYYPQAFKERFENIISNVPKKNRREEKEKLTKDLMKWIEENEDEAKRLFENSAKEVIDLLKQIKLNLIN